MGINFIGADGEKGEKGDPGEGITECWKYNNETINIRKLNYKYSIKCFQN